MKTTNSCSSPFSSSMSHSDRDDQRKVESTSRMWAEPGPSRGPPSRQGYCGYCRVLYSNLDQHLSSLSHLESVRTSSRVSGSSVDSSRTKLTLMERFLQDVLQHHPHHYSDPRPSHADLPTVSAPPLPRAVLDELRFSEGDSLSLGTREQLPSSDGTSCQLANQQEEDSIYSQSLVVTKGTIQDMLSGPIRDQEDKGTIPTEHKHPPLAILPPPPQSQAPPSVHRKAHRKTNRRKTSESSSTSPPPRDPGPRNPDPRPTDRRLSLDHSDPLDRTIDQVIQRCCYGSASTSCQQEETESFHCSLPVSLETTSEDWDSPVQVVLPSSHTPVQVREGQDLGRLMDAHVDLDDQVYSYQLDSALHHQQEAGGGARQDQGFWSLPIEEVLPAPAYIPESFRGKTWAQIEQDDEEKVEKLVGQFRRGKFICYFDSESLARYGRRSQKKECVKDQESGSNTAPPLLDCDEDDCLLRRRRSFRVASRCQVVKVSHSTQTVRLVVPAVRQPPPETPPTRIPTANHDAAVRTPEVQMWRCLPASYSGIITPVQPRTSLVYLLGSSSGHTPSCTLSPDSASKRCRKKRRPLNLQRIKVKYKRLPVRFYDPSTNRIFKNLPKGSLRPHGPAPSGPPPPCVRQLFRSLSPDLNTGLAGSSRVKVHASADPTLSHTSSGDAAQTVRRRGRTAITPPPGPHSRLERGRGGRKETKSRAKATPPQPRRESLRGGPARVLPRRRGSRRRSCERGRR